MVVNSRIVYGVGVLEELRFGSSVRSETGSVEETPVYGVKGSKSILFTLGQFFVRVLVS